MKTKKVNQTVFKTILIILAVAVLFMIISVKLFFMQLRNSSDQITGEITNISQNEITIVSKNGKETILVLTKKTFTRNDRGELTTGQFVYSFGTMQDDGTFISKGIKVVKKP